MEDLASVICDNLPTVSHHGEGEKGSHKDTTKDVEKGSQMGRTTGDGEKDSHKDTTGVKWPSLAGCVLTAGLEILLRCLRVGASLDLLTEKLIALTRFQWVCTYRRLYSTFVIDSTEF